MRIVISDILFQLQNQFNSRLSYFIGSNRDMELISRTEFEGFVNYMYKKQDRILSYLTAEFPSSDLELRATTGTYIFNFTIHKDKSSTFNIQFLKSLSREYDSKFLSDRVSNRSGYVYILKSDFGYKIGCTGRLKDRISHFNLKLPFKIEVVSVIKCEAHNKIESFLHTALKHKRINGEWFDLNNQDFTDMDILLGNINLKRENYLYEQRTTIL